MNKPARFKIYFYLKGVLSTDLAHGTSFNDINANVLVINRYQKWAMVKDIQSNLYHWRDKKIDKAVLQRELAIQKCVEINIYN